MTKEGRWEKRHTCAMCYKRTVHVASCCAVFAFKLYALCCVAAMAFTPRTAVLNNVAISFLSSFFLFFLFFLSGIGYCPSFSLYGMMRTTDGVHWCTR